MTSTIPERAEPHSLDGYLEVMTRAVFQAGVSWAMIAQRWDAFRRAFCNFECARVAAFDDLDIERALQENILRSPKKVRATIGNAQTMLALDKEYGGFKDYLRSFSSYDALSTDIRRRFKFMGAMNVWYLLFRVGETVPPFEEWVKTIPGDHPRMQEMVEKARRDGTLRN
ncbi:MAG: DNA-3-methyladenine glycosylase I [Candidatus Eremiobacteraeota bacterium]|nr:DNA-3-methyladenine glycosylase I [Candidatus Eremiobacteraeota bacterium]